VTFSTTTRTPSTRDHTPVLGAHAVAEPHHTHPAPQDLLDRVADPDYRSWLSHVMPAASCSQPIRLRVQAEWRDELGRVTEVDRISNEMPDGVLYVACKNRRASVCPGCAATYRADMYQLVKAGMLGGKGVPETVTEHPCLFVTLTAPSFGLVHTASRPGKARPCTPRRNASRCPHGVVMACWLTHPADDPHATPRVGEPLCRDCYDYDHQAVWNLHAGELWRRTTITINRRLTTLAKSLGARLRLSYAKVAEYQHRGAVHFHALIRLDGYDPDDREAVLPPHPGVTVEHLESLVDDAIRATHTHTAPHPRNRSGWPITWGEQLDIRAVHLHPSDLDDHGQLTNTAVAGYLAKYATKATEATGHVSKRLTSLTIRLADQDTHQNRQLQACWYLGQYPIWVTSTAQREEWDHGVGTLPGWGRLQRWAHMLGYGGHFATKSRRYSTTLTALREVRRAFQLGRRHDEPPVDEPPRDHDEDGDQAEIIVTHTFDGVGWLTTADAQLANTAAAKAREHRLTARDEMDAAIQLRR
jgi:replication initiator protein RepSA